MLPPDPAQPRYGSDWRAQPGYPTARGVRPFSPPLGPLPSDPIGVLLASAQPDPEAYARRRLQQAQAAGLFPGGMPTPGQGGYAALWRGVSGGLGPWAAQHGYQDPGYALRQAGQGQLRPPNPNLPPGLAPAAIGGAPAALSPGPLGGFQAPPELIAALLHLLGSRGGPTPV